MSLITDAAVTRSWFFSDIQTNDIFWLAADRRQPHHCMAEFRGLNEDGVSRDFLCLNGAWRGTLTEQEEGALELHVHFTGSRHYVYITEKVERAKPETTEEEDDGVPF